MTLPYLAYIILGHFSAITDMRSEPGEIFSEIGTDKIIFYNNFVCVTCWIPMITKYFVKISNMAWKVTVVGAYQLTKSSNQAWMLDVGTLIKLTDTK